ncbi:hypothetical protein M3Y99_01027100 [Aphelenchoides fujianensis]|nr:hypothetical protein M3Y99_01027100 [Aphelenchoides fujianensis]
MLLRRVCVSSGSPRLLPPRPPSPTAQPEGVWAEVKTLTAQLAAAPAAHADESFKRLEHVGYARLSAAAEQTAGGQKAERFPLNADHVRAAIRTVLASKTLEDPVGAAWRLAAFLVDLQLTKLDDEWILDGPPAGRALDFFDALKNDGRTFGVDELRYVCSVAAAVKEPKILEPLVQMHRMLPSNHSARLELFNTLAMLYGKRGDLDAIDVLWRSLRKQIKPKDHPRYEHVFQRCRHFYRCNNRKIPEELTEFLPKTSKF